MKPYLLDVNVLIALAWPSHVHHRLAQRWFSRKRSAGFRTCPITQLGFVRVSCHSQVGGDGIAPRDAAALLSAVTALPEHSFWPCQAGLNEAIGNWERVFGHRQITDAYLLGLARERGGVFATLDRAVLSLPGAGGNVELLLG